MGARVGLVHLVCACELSRCTGQFERNIDQEQAASNQRMFAAIEHDEQMGKAPCCEILGDSKSLRASKPHYWFKSFSNFAEWVQAM